MRAVLAPRPGAAEIANRAVTQELRKLLVGLDVGRTEGTTTEFLVERQHRAIDIAKISHQEDLFGPGIKLPNQPGQIVGTMLLGHVDDVLLSLTGGDAKVGFLGIPLAKA